MNTTKVKFDRSKKAERLRLYHPFEDADRDNVPNLFQPFNPNEQGLREFLLNIPATISSGVGTTSAVLKPVVRGFSNIVQPLTGTHPKPNPEWERTKEGSVVLPTEPTSEVKRWEQKWTPYIKGTRFTGTEAQYQEYVKSFHKYYKKGDDNQYVLREEYSRLTPEAQRYEKALGRYEKERWFGIPYKIQSLEKKYSPFVKKIIPPVEPFTQVKTPEDLIKAIEKIHEWSGAKPLTPEERRTIKESYSRGEKVYGTYRRLWGLPSKPFEWEKKAARLSTSVKAGQVEEIREHPVKGAITVASFAALSPILKGAGAVWKGTGLATKLPRVTKYAPRVVMGSIAAGYAGAVGHEIYKAPTLEKKGKIIGRTSIELGEMELGTKLGELGVKAGVEAAKYMSSYAKSKVFPFESLNILIADTSGMARLRRKWAQEQAEREAKFLRGEYKMRRTSTGGIVIEEVEPQIKMGYGRGSGRGSRRKKISTQRRTTTRFKEREAKRLAERRMKRRKEQVKRIKEQQREREMITVSPRSAEKEFARMRTELSTGQGTRSLLIAKIGYKPLAGTLRAQQTKQFIVPITRTKQKELTGLVAKEQYAVKQKEEAKEEAVEEAITEAIAKQGLRAGVERLLSYREVPIEKELLTGSTVIWGTGIKQRERRPTSIRRISTKKRKKIPYPRAISKRGKKRGYRYEKWDKFLRIAPVATPEQFLKGMTKRAPGTTKKSKSIMKLIEGAI